MKKKIVVLMLVMTTLAIAGCNGNSSESENVDSYESEEETNDEVNTTEIETDEETSKNSNSSYTSSYSNTPSSSSSKTIEHYCEASGCYKEGIIAVTGFSGDPEYYCQEHYDEMQNIIGKMEQDVGTGTYSQHQCEECTKEGTHELIGFSGEPEYYCTEHYNELIDLINELYEN